MKRSTSTTFVWILITLIASAIACGAETTIAHLPSPSPPSTNDDAATTSSGEISVTPAVTLSSAPSLFDQIIAHSPSLSPSLLWSQSANAGKLQLTPTKYRIEKEYTLSTGVVTPPPGAAFLWVLVRISNSSDAAEAPLFIFELYYQGEITHETTFGVDQPANYQGFAPDKIYPGQSREGWILFEMPEQIDLSKAYLAVRPILSPAEYVVWQISS